jgi:hypothetical protein
VSLIIALTKGVSVLHVWSSHFLYSAPSFLTAGMLSLGVIAIISSASVFLLAAVIGVVAVAYYCAVRLTAQAVVD